MVYLSYTTDINIFLLTKDLINGKFEPHLVPYSRKENGSIKVMSDTAYFLALDIMYLRYGIRPDLLKKVTRNGFQHDPTV